MRHFDLCLIGSGSGNSIPDEQFADRSVALVEKGAFGGTCLNVGCIPTKMFVYPADLALTPAESRRLGVDLQPAQVHWPEIRDRIFGRVDAISRDGEKWRAENPNVTLYRSSARFVGPRTLDTGGETLTADQFVIAAGSRPVIPTIPGLDSVRSYTSDTVMRLERLPSSLIIVGGGHIAAEFAHIFASYGTAVTVVNRSDALLRQHDRDVSRRFTELIGRRVRVLLDTDVEAVRGDADGVTLSVRNRAGEVGEVAAEVLLLATGRRPNSDLLSLESAGVQVDDAGFVVVDQHQRTSADGVYALGDISSHYQLKHVANCEARVVKHNLLHPDALDVCSRGPVPSAVFSSPQVASVGLTEQQAAAEGRRYVTATQEYGSVAYGWAMEDTEHFCKLVADPASGELLGAHLIGPQASILIQPLIQAISSGMSARAMATEQYWIHPALTEVVENALLALPLD
ncbi:MAG: mycothione reductase [Actinomycetes bacterium]